MKMKREPAVIFGKAADVMTKHESRLADIVARHWSKVCLRAYVPPSVPAACTTRSIVSAASTAGANFSGSLASATTYRAPISSAAERNGPSCRAVRITSYPSSTSLRPQALPMPPLPPVIKAVRTPHLSALASRERLRRKRHNASFGILGEEKALSVGEMACRQLAGALGIARCDRIGDLGVDAKRDAPLADRRILAPSRRLVGPPLQVTAPQCLQTADHRDHGVVTAATHDFIVKLAADLGETRAVLDVFCHRIVEFFEL